jgi:hypothetical protein
MVTTVPIPPSISGASQTSGKLSIIALAGLAGS